MLLFKFAFFRVPIQFIMLFLLFESCRIQDFVTLQFSKKQKWYWYTPDWLLSLSNYLYIPRLPQQDNPRVKN